MGWGEPNIDAAMLVERGRQASARRAMEQENKELRELLCWALGHVEYIPDEYSRTRYRRAEKLVDSQ